jgi:hypothetical protein
VHGAGFSFSVPQAWRSTTATGIVAARRGNAVVSVRTFRLVKPYDPARFGAAAKELDGIAGRLASAAGASLTEKQTTTVDGVKIRAYRFGSTRIGFFLSGRREYQLLCRLAPDGTDRDGACSLLFASFSAA